VDQNYDRSLRSSHHHLCVSLSFLFFVARHTLISPSVFPRTQSFENTRKGSVAETIRGSIFVGFIAIYTFDLSIRACGFPYPPAFLSLRLLELTRSFSPADGLGWRSFKANGWSEYSGRIFSKGLNLKLFCLFVSADWFDLIVIAGSLATTIPVLFGLETSALVQLQRLFLCSIALKLIQK